MATKPAATKKATAKPAPVAEVAPAVEPIPAPTTRAEAKAANLYEPQLVERDANLEAILAIASGAADVPVPAVPHPAYLAVVELHAQLVAAKAARRAALAERDALDTKLRDRRPPAPTDPGSKPLWMD